jgi:acetyl-CoA synthetase
MGEAVPTTGKTYERICAEFRWNVPDIYNIGVNVCGRYAASINDTALTALDADGGIQQYSYLDLEIYSNRLANRLRASGVLKGDRVAALLPPSFEAAVALVASWKAGLVVVPLFTGTTAAALELRLRASGAKILFIDRKNLSLVEEISPAVAELSVEVLPLKGDSSGRHRLLETVTETAQSAFEAARTTPNDPAFLAFTSGSEGAPKGVLHAHRQAAGATSTFGLRSQPPGRGEVTWSPADWGWLMGINVALCAWYSGGSVLVQEGAVFDPGRALKLMADFGVQHASLTPTALTLIQKTDTGRYHPKLRGLATGGEPLGAEIFDWVRDRFGITLDEFFGMSECPGLIGNGDLVEARRGALGVALPGHDVQVVNESGEVVPQGDLGCIAVNRLDPGLFLGYWLDGRLVPPEYCGDFYLTSDLARMDADGYFWHLGRGDDVIKSGGYRIGPSEIEDCATSHPAVELAGAVGCQDKILGQVVKLWVKLKESSLASDDLKNGIHAHIRQRLPAYQWPRKIEFIDAMPLTASSKISRRDLREMN